MRVLKLIRSRCQLARNSPATMPRSSPAVAVRSPAGQVIALPSPHPADDTAGVEQQQLQQPAAGASDRPVGAGAPSPKGGPCARLPWPRPAPSANHRPHWWRWRDAVRMADPSSFQKPSALYHTARDGCRPSKELLTLFRFCFCFRFLFSDWAQVHMYVYMTATARLSPCSTSAHVIPLLILLLYQSPSRPRVVRRLEQPPP